jgi:murein peptide amidase A
MGEDAARRSGHSAATSDGREADGSSRPCRQGLLLRRRGTALIFLALVLAAGCAYSSPTSVGATISDRGLVKAASRWSTTVPGEASAPDSRAHVRPRRFGTSVLGRPLRAYRVGDRRSGVTAVLLGNMHGNEPAGVRLVKAVLADRRVRGVDVWVVPTINPDGLAADTRQNAHGVDLNRNWAHRWRPQTGPYDSGPRPFSEPETRAMRRFLDRVDPRFVVSFHQPLHGVDSDAAKNRHLLNRLARNLHLPKKPLRCSGVCHGTMTGWYNAHHGGSAITVELGPRPSAAYLIGRGARGTVSSILGHF